MEGVYGMFGVDSFLYSVFVVFWCERQWWRLARFNARDSTIFHYLLYVDSQSTVYQETEEVGADNHDYYLVLMDYVSSTSLGFSGGGRVPCLGTVGDMYGNELLSLYQGHQDESFDSIGIGIDWYAGAEV